MRPRNTLKKKRRPEKKSSFKRKKDWDFSNGITNSDLENINNVIYAHKSQLAAGKGSWKVIPKDSCEIYKNRRKRRAESQNKKVEQSSEDDDSEDDRSHNKIKESSRRKCQCDKKKFSHRCYSHSSSDMTRTETESSFSSLEEMDE